MNEYSTFMAQLKRFDFKSKTDCHSIDNSLLCKWVACLMDNCSLRDIDEKYAEEQILRIYEEKNNVISTFNNFHPVDHPFT